MAVVNTVDDEVLFPQPALFAGASVKMIQKLVAVAAADDDGSIYLVGEIPGEAVILDVRCLNKAITAGTDYDLGLYNVDGTVYSADKILNGIDMSSARTAFTSLAPDFGADNCEKMVFEHLGHVSKVVPGSGEVAAKKSYRLGLKANTVGSAAGSIVLQILYRDSI